MKDQIAQFVWERGGGVTFAEFSHHFGADFQGDIAMCMASNENIVLWSGMSKAFLDALSSLLADGVIKMTPTEPLVYFIDGLAPTLPVVKRRYKYKTPHWLPVAFDLGDGTKIPLSGGK